MPSRDILHLHVPSFAVAVVRIGSPALRDRPVAVVPPNGRGVVLGVSAEARRAGVVKGLPVARARRLCRDLEMVSLAPDSLTAAAGALTGLARQYTPLWEPARPGHLFLDLTGARRLLGVPRDVGARLERDLTTLGFSGAVGVGGNKVVSRVASQFLEAGGVCDVLRGNEASFLAPLPLDLLPGLEPARRRILEGWSLRRIGELSSVPVRRLEEVFGPEGRALRARARGEDWEPVRRRAPAPRWVSSEVLTEAADDPLFLWGRVKGCLGVLCGRLRREGRRAGRLEVWLGYADGVPCRRAGRITPPSWWEHEIDPLSRRLFEGTLSRRVRVRTIGVAVSRLSSGGGQLALFGSAVADPRREVLAKTLDEIRRRQGAGAVGWGDGLIVPPGKGG